MKSNPIGVIEILAGIGKAVVEAVRARRQKKTATDVLDAHGQLEALKAEQRAYEALRKRQADETR